MMNDRTKTRIDEMKGGLEMYFVLREAVFWMVVGNVASP
jgi:hypothetical protein